ncbi:MAG: HigA family addiction module antidote protein [Chloroflexi bacterium]|nr:HigA family addiction module antidote protein [Chloroflexota bacterium]
MATKVAIPFRTDRLVPPGEVLAEELRARAMSQTGLARLMGRPIQVINAIVTGKKTVTAETALQMEKALDIPAEFWLNLEAMYQLGKVRARSPE